MKLITKITMIYKEHAKDKTKSNPKRDSEPTSCVQKVWSECPSSTRRYAHCSVRAGEWAAACSANAFTAASGRSCACAICVAADATLRNAPETQFSSCSNRGKGGGLT